MQTDKQAKEDETETRTAKADSMQASKQASKQASWKRMGKGRSTKMQTDRQCTEREVVAGTTSTPAASKKDVRRHSANPQAESKHTRSKQAIKQASKNPYMYIHFHAYM